MLLRVINATIGVETAAIVEHMLVEIVLRLNFPVYLLAQEATERSKTLFQKGAISIFSSFCLSVFLEIKHMKN